MKTYIKRGGLAVTALSGCLLLAVSVQAASFDCVKAQSKVEHIICDNAEISRLDDELSAAYKTALKNKTQANSIKQEQKQWMKVRNACANVVCVKSAYETRLTVLGSSADSSDSDEFTSGSIDMDNAERHFKLIMGKGVEVCEIYKKNLEALGNPNLACERKVSPEYQGIIKLPVWRKLDLFENRNLWAQVEKMANGGLDTPERMASRDTPMDDQSEIDKLAKRYQEYAKQYHKEVYKLNVADMDVNNDGMSEPVLREHSGLCGEHVHYHSTALFVLNEKNDTVDVQKSRPLFQDSGSNRWSKDVQRNGTFENGSMYDVFFYKDKTYFDRWTWTGIWIYKISNDETQAICRLN